MKLFARVWFTALCISVLCHAQISSFQHVVVIVQENRTPDNLFQGLCGSPFGSIASCSVTPTATQYDIQTSGWLDKLSRTGKINPLTVPLAGTYDLSHSHPSFKLMCDLDPSTETCKMDGAGRVACSGDCTGVTQPQFRYVDNSTAILDPYLAIATEYGWANYMFQTNQGPSFPAHQFIFGGTSAPSAEDDAIGTFASENTLPQNSTTGCLAPADKTVQLINSSGVEDPSNVIYPCFEHETVADLLQAANITWRYYTPNHGNGIWTAPNAIRHICQPDGGECTGPEYLDNVDTTPADVLVDINRCRLRQATWVIPNGQNSDHADINTGGGPDWVASIVNAIGQSKCRNTDGSSYWDTTAILITWDDWGGWYDHEAPQFLAFPEGAYQYGFRVPLIVVSAYTPERFISNQRHEFGSVIRFMERNFGIAEGSLNFADARASTDLSEFFELHTAPRVFKTIPAGKKAKYFIEDKTPATDPDDD